VGRCICGICVVGRCIGIEGRAICCGIWGRCIGICGRAICCGRCIGICGRDICGAAGRAMGAAGLAIGAAGRAMGAAGRPPPAFPRPRWAAAADTGTADTTIMQTQANNGRM
jgi:hypothetical protein